MYLKIFSHIPTMEAGLEMRPTVSEQPTLRTLQLICQARELKG
jgi:hypothetical protein